MNKPPRKWRFRHAGAVSLGENGLYGPEVIGRFGDDQNASTRFALNACDVSGKRWEDGMCRPPLEKPDCQNFVLGGTG